MAALGFEVIKQHPGQVQATRRVKVQVVLSDGQS